ncbi:MAG: alpha/beta-type small acid-soluble spore protein [Eubacteriales bacterium]
MEQKQGLEQLKYEVANELNAQLGPDRSARENGSVGGEMTKRLVQFAEQNMKNGQKI